MGPKCTSEAIAMLCLVTLSHTWPVSTSSQRQRGGQQGSIHQPGLDQQASDLYNIDCEITSNTNLSGEQQQHAAQLIAHSVEASTRTLAPAQPPSLAGWLCRYIPILASQSFCPAPTVNPHPEIKDWQVGGFCAIMPGHKTMRCLLYSRNKAQQAHPSPAQVCWRFLTTFIWVPQSYRQKDMSLHAVGLLFFYSCTVSFIGHQIALMHCKFNFSAVTFCVFALLRMCGVQASISPSLLGRHPSCPNLMQALD